MNELDVRDDLLPEALNGIHDRIIQAVVALRLVDLQVIEKIITLNSYTLYPLFIYLKPKLCFWWLIHYERCHNNSLEERHRASQRKNLVIIFHISDSHVELVLPIRDLIRITPHYVQRVKV